MGFLANIWEKVRGCFGRGEVEADGGAQDIGLGIINNNIAPAYRVATPPAPMSNKDIYGAKDVWHLKSGAEQYAEYAKGRAEEAAAAAAAVAAGGGGLPQIRVEGDEVDKVDKAN